MLCIQGFIRSCTWRDGAWKRGLNPFEIRVSFELSPLLPKVGDTCLNPFEIRVSFEPMLLKREGRREVVSIPSRSGFHSNFALAESLRVMKSLNPFEIRVSFERYPESVAGFWSVGLNPFEIRVSFEPGNVQKIAAEMYVSIPSRSGFHSNQTWDQIYEASCESQSLRDQGFIRTLATSRTFSQRTSAGVFPIFVWRRRLDSKL